MDCFRRLLFDLAFIPRSPIDSLTLQCIVNMYRFQPSCRPDLGGLESALILVLERWKALSRSDSACGGCLNRQSATNWMRFMLSYSSVSGSIHDLQEKVLIIRKSIGPPTDRLNLSAGSQVKSCVTLYSGVA